MMKDVLTLEEGKSFGELALLHNKARAASIMTLEDSHFAIMNKPNFDQIMHAIKLRENNLLVEFLDCFNYIKHLTYQTKIKLAYFGVEKRFSYGQKVFDEGEPTKYIYLIKQGDFEISKDVYFIK